MQEYVIAIRRNQQKEAADTNWMEEILADAGVFEVGGAYNKILVKMNPKKAADIEKEYPFLICEEVMPHYTDEKK